MYAIVETGGKQLKVEPGKVVHVEKLAVEPGEKVVFDRVLCVRDGEVVRIGTPYVEDAKVTGEVVEHFRGEKILIIKHKRRKNYRRRQGHRQWYTAVKIESIN
ncbi:50S ribosomal protein L21 [Thermodesulforhabdus norvegica]|uniref:Large ribosomal subunit protein bL21 n=1 Tax=Thermodesulforhabdus norvegica TaxID=39841 RepID=A0A1I4UB70_9BACT|nr:50S ribosomal protein L21 [Thermodesulforhabdus norvegica]SFM85973.1 large subunit ribosomal protein L21 [Thermodesulforhabdus norvegica]